VPVVVRNKAIAADAAWWIDALAEIVADLEQEWSITVGRPFDEGTEAFVAEAEMADGTPAVLKVLVPRGPSVTDHEATVLRLADGDGCPLLHRDDPDRGALLIERLGPSMFALGMPYEQRLPALCDAAALIWRPAGDAGLPTGAEKADRLIDFVTTTWQLLDRPCAERTVEHARRVRRSPTSRPRRRAGGARARRRAPVECAPRRRRLQAGRPGRPPRRSRVRPRGHPARRPRRAARGRPDVGRPLDGRRCDLDATAIFEWAVIERVSTGLLATQIELQPVGRQMLQLADHLALAT
jgi:streptomycin 6-kinase